MPIEQAAIFRSKNMLAVALIAAVALVLAGFIGVNLYRGHKKKVDDQRAAALIAETTAELRQALGAAPPAEAVAKIDGYLQGVKAMSGDALAGAAERYILGAREIARRRADSERLLKESAASRAALEAHMGRAAGRGPGWIHTAASLKKKVEADHADLGRSLKALDDLLAQLDEAQKLLGARVEPSSLLEDGVRQAARARAQEEAKRANAELERVRRLTP